MVMRVSLKIGFQVCCQRYQRLPLWFSSKGLTFCEIASRALKIRERTVPIGQFMASDISS
jgi:radical SAM superfamily enzyme